MIVESLDEYLETVAGFIFDDDKLVSHISFKAVSFLLKFFDMLMLSISSSMFI